jgi:hypothetical protein
MAPDAVRTRRIEQLDTAIRARILDEFCGSPDSSGMSPSPTSSRWLRCRDDAIHARGPGPDCDGPAYRTGEFIYEPAGSWNVRIGRNLGAEPLVLDVV